MKMGKNIFFISLLTIMICIIACADAKKTHIQKKQPDHYPFIPYKERFIANQDGTVLDLRTNLMWASSDNGKDINWHDAKKYCETYQGGGYKDWRMPTMSELEWLYNSSSNVPASKQECCSSCETMRITNLIHLTCHFIWSSEKEESIAAAFSFTRKLQLTNIVKVNHPITNYGKYRALPVRKINDKEIDNKSNL